MARKSIQKASETATIIIDKLTRHYKWARSGCSSRKEFKTFGGCVRAATRLGYEVTTTVDPMPEFLANDKKTRIVEVLVGGKLARIGVNTPLCCDPSSETYWSM